MSPRRPRRPFNHHRDGEGDSDRDSELGDREKVTVDSGGASEAVDPTSLHTPTRGRGGSDADDRRDTVVALPHDGISGHRDLHDHRVTGSRPRFEDVFEDPDAIGPEVVDSHSAGRHDASEPAAEDLRREGAEPLAFPEPEVRVTRRRRRRALLWASGALGLLVAVVAVLYFSPLLTIHRVEVENNDLLTEDRAQDLLQPIYGRPLPQVGNAQIQELLRDEAVVEDVVVQGALPDTVTVEIVEHPPVAEVEVDGGLMFYNDHGEVIRTFNDPEDEASEGYATPSISDGVALEDDVVFQAVVSVLGELPLSARESMESADADSIDSVRLLLEDGRTIFWGAADRGPEKAAVLEAVLTSEAEEFVEVDTIDISTPETPVTR